MPVTSRKGSEGSARSLLLLGLAVSALLTLLFFVASWHSLGRGGGERVAEAFRSNALGIEIWGDEVSGRHRFNDCLITALALEQRQPKLQLAISPVNAAEPRDDVCVDLRDGTGPSLGGYYHNYLHGQVVLLRYLLPHLSIEIVKETYKAVQSMLLLAALALCLLRLSDGARREESIVFAIVLLGLSRFFGLEWFGQSLGHGPSDLVLIGFIAWLALRAGRMRRREWVVGAAVFGTLTMMFELLTGGLPLGAAAVIGLGWFALREDERNPGAVGLGLIGYGIGVATVVLTKLFLVAVVFGPEAVLDIASSGLARASSENPPEFAGASASTQLLVHFGVLAPGLPALVGGLLCLSAALGLLAARRHPQPPFLLLLGSVVPILAWYAIFRQHTAIHGWFMARLLVWPLVAGFALCALGALRANVRSRFGADGHSDRWASEEAGIAMARDEAAPAR